MKKEERINYQTNEEIWKLERELKEKGYKKTSEAYWAQIFEDDNGNRVITTRKQIKK